MMGIIAPFPKLHGMVVGAALLALGGILLHAPAQLFAADHAHGDQHAAHPSSARAGASDPLLPGKVSGTSSANDDGCPLCGPEKIEGDPAEALGFDVVEFSRELREGIDASTKESLLEKLRALSCSALADPAKIKAAFKRNPKAFLARLVREKENKDFIASLSPEELEVFRQGLDKKIDGCAGKSRISNGPHSSHSAHQTSNSDSAGGHPQHDTGGTSHGSHVGAQTSLAVGGNDGTDHSSHLASGSLAPAHAGHSSGSSDLTSHAGNSSPKSQPEAQHDHGSNPTAGSGRQMLSQPHTSHGTDAGTSDLGHSQHRSGSANSQNGAEAHAGHGASGSRPNDAHNASHDGSSGHQNHAGSSGASGDAPANHSGHSGHSASGQSEHSGHSGYTGDGDHAGHSGGGGGHQGHAGHGSTDDGATHGGHAQAPTAGGHKHGSRDQSHPTSHTKGSRAGTTIRHHHEAIDTTIDNSSPQLSDAAWLGPQSMQSKMNCHIAYSLFGSDELPMPYSFGGYHDRRMMTPEKLFYFPELELKSSAHGHGPGF